MCVLERDTEPQVDPQVLYVLYSSQRTSILQMG